MKKIVILGGAESGTGSAILAKQKNYEVFLSDIGKIKDKYKEILLAHHIDFEENKHTEKKILQADEIIKSPVIPDNIPLILKIKSKNIPIISEIEFAGRYTNAKIIGITGSNGKTTTTLLIAHLLQKAGLNIGLAGNIGQSFAYQVATKNFDYYVLELSSFQLDGVFDFKIDIAILLNITPDHLDRYNYKFENYLLSKFRILQNQTEKDFFIYCQDDENINNHLSKIDLKSQKLSFSIFDNFLKKGAFLQEKNFIIKYQNEENIFRTSDFSLQGNHNIYNAMASILLGKILKINEKIIKKSLQTFKAVEHRLEKFTRIKGIDFINDSKATNVNSTFYALESMTKKTIWILGGIDKGNNYSLLDSLVKEKVKAIIALGKDNEKIKKHFQNKISLFYETDNLQKAVEKSFLWAKENETVLLSPSCASFDLFQTYEDRGKKFKKTVLELK